MIASFAHQDAEALFKGYRVRRFIRIESVIRRKLAQLNAAATLDILRAPPGNRLEMLQGDRFGQYSIRVNDQYRICFRWSEGDARDVEIVDYH
jgi:proteic killer suppression protein